jgi:hypothetical protein
METKRMIKRVNETKRIFKEIKQTFSQTNQKKNQINKIKRWKGGHFKTDTDEIQKIRWEYFENLYSNKLENQEETDKFLDIYNPPKLNFIQI